MQKKKKMSPFTSLFFPFFPSLIQNIITFENLDLDFKSRDSECTTNFYEFEISCFYLLIST